jgi:methylthioribose-1-phosphate isomerase
VAAAITAMVVRGAPAIGVAAAYGAVLACDGAATPAVLAERLARLRAARPTAVNLAWALDRMAAACARGRAAALAEAQAIHAEDVSANRTMAGLGAALLAPGSRVLTHCNTGALATAGVGTALGVIRRAWAEGRLAGVHATETRPWLQGARLTAWELLRDGIPVTLIGDGAAAALMRRHGVDWLIVGADRVAANGDVANKIGTYGLAVQARYHGARVMVVAPLSTLDPQLPDGDAIRIEERDADEVLCFGGVRVAAAGAGAWNPVFDVTPAALVDVLVTERGVVERPDVGSIAGLLAAVQGDVPCR